MLKEEITISWHHTDILCVRPDLYKHQAYQVLEEIKMNHDPSIGINWDIIEYYCNKLFPL